MTTAEPPSEPSRKRPPDVMRVGEAAERLGVSRQHVYTLVDRDEIPGGLRLGHRVGVRRVPFDQWMRGELTVRQWQARNATPGRN